MLEYINFVDGDSVTNLKWMKEGGRGEELLSQGY